MEQEFNKDYVNLSREAEANIPIHSEEDFGIVKVARFDRRLTFAKAGIRGYRMPTESELTRWVVNPAGRIVAVQWDDIHAIPFAEHNQEDTSLIDPKTMKFRHWRFATQEEIDAEKVRMEAERAKNVARNEEQNKKFAARHALKEVLGLNGSREI